MRGECEPRALKQQLCPPKTLKKKTNRNMNQKWKQNISSENQQNVYGMNVCDMAKKKIRKKKNDELKIRMKWKN